MKKYLEENIKFHTQLFTSLFYATIILIGGLIGLFLKENFGVSKKDLFVFLLGFIFFITFIVALIYSYQTAKGEIDKLKNYE